LPKLDGAPHGQGVHAEQVSNFAIREREARICFAGGGRRHKNLPGQEEPAPLLGGAYMPGWAPGLANKLENYSERTTPLGLE
jgi:hypothetical protein